MWPGQASQPCTCVLDFQPYLACRPFSLLPVSMQSRVAEERHKNVSVKSPMCSLDTSYRTRACSFSLTFFLKQPNTPQASMENGLDSTLVWKVSQLVSAPSTPFLPSTCVSILLCFPASREETALHSSTFLSLSCGVNSLRPPQASGTSSFLHFFFF